MFACTIVVVTVPLLACGHVLRIRRNKEDDGNGRAGGGDGEGAEKGLEKKLEGNEE